MTVVKRRNGDLPAVLHEPSGTHVSNDQFRMILAASSVFGVFRIGIVDAEMIDCAANAVSYVPILVV